jgi:hypothetical protein
MINLNGPTCDAAGFAAARLGEDQISAESMEHDAFPSDDEYYWCPAARPGPIGDLKWGEEYCDCGVEARKARRLREVEAGRRILSRHGGHAWHGIPCADLLDLLARWQDHPNYNQIWADCAGTAAPESARGIK